MKKFLIFLLIFFLAISGFVIFRLVQINNLLRASLPYLLPGEKIEYFELTNKDSESNIRITRNEPLLIFIFSRPCTACDKNIYFWNKIVELTDFRIKAIGIVMDSAENAALITQKIDLKFKIFVPKDLTRFATSFRLRLPESQTILYNNGVIKVYIGELDSSTTIRVVEDSNLLGQALM